MFSKFPFVFWALNAVASATVGSTLFVDFKVSEEQRQRIVDYKATPAQVRKELVQPLSQEKLAELEKAAGMKLEDIWGYDWGRTLRTEHYLSEEELDVVKENLYQIPWIRKITLRSVMTSDDPKQGDWRDREYWLKPEEKKFELR